MRAWYFLIALTAVAAMLPEALAQKKKPDAKDRPQLVLADPFVVTAGKPTKITLRGLRLDGITELRCHEPKSGGRLQSTPAKSGVDAKFLNQLGDMQVQVEITAAPELAGSDLVVSVVGEAGESSLLRLFVDDGGPTVPEKEPNNGFHHAQPVPVSCVITGAIQNPHDVDVFRFEGQPGEQLLLTVQAARYGSPLDPVLTVYDSRGQVLAVSDDTPRTENAQLRLTLPRAGGYFVALADSNDQGGALFKYRLQVAKGK
ncbi:MAG: hypothetical protein ACJ8F7_16555 [Gemmataceae bacterium]